MTKRDVTAQPLGCQAKVWNPGYWNKRDCLRDAKVFVEGVGFCAQHARKAQERGIRSVQ